MEVPFPVLYPTVQTGQAEQQQVRAYTLNDQQGNPHHAYVVVWRQNGIGGYYDFEGSDWLNPPLFAHARVQTIDGRAYRMVDDGSHIHVIGWRSGRVLYWLTNTLLEELSNQQMLPPPRLEHIPANPQGNEGSSWLREVCATCDKHAERRPVMRSPPNGTARLEAGVTESPATGRTIFGPIWRRVRKLFGDLRSGIAGHGVRLDRSGRAEPSGCPLPRRDCRMLSNHWNSVSTKNPAGRTVDLLRMKPSEIVARRSASGCNSPGMDADRPLPYREAEFARLHSAWE